MGVGFLTDREISNKQKEKAGINSVVQELAISV